MTEISGIFSIEVEVAERDLSPIYNHIHHAQIFYYLERARLAYLDKIGFSSDSLIERGLFPVISQIQIRYLRELVVGAYQTTCEEFAIDGRSLCVTQRLINQKGKDMVVARVESMLLSKESGRAVFPEESLRMAFCSSKPL